MVELIQDSWTVLVSEKLFPELKGLCVDIFVIESCCSVLAVSLDDEALRLNTV